VETEHTLGTLTKDLAVPWTEDYKDCDETFWPTGRPGIMFVSDTENTDWMLLPGAVIEHVHHVETGAEYYRDYWKWLRFIRRRDKEFVAAE
jgi:hypothetical protein